MLLLGNTQKQRRARNECRGLCTLFAKLPVCGSKRFDRESDLTPSPSQPPQPLQLQPSSTRNAGGGVGGNGYHSGTRTDVGPGVAGRSVAWALVVDHGGRTRARNSPRSRARSFRKEERSTEKSENSLGQQSSEPNLGEFLL